MPAQSSHVPRFQAPKRDWKNLVDIARNTIAGIMVEFEPELLSGEGISAEEWHRGLLQTHTNLEPTLDGAKTSLILADAIIQNLENDPSLKPTLEINEQLLQLMYVYRGIRIAAQQADELVNAQPSLEVDSSVTPWSDIPSLGSDPWGDWEQSDPVEWIAVLTPEPSAYGIASTMRVSQGLYTTPSRFASEAYDRWRMEVRFQNPRVVVYDAPITQPKTLEPILNNLSSGESDEAFSLIIIAEWVSDEVLAMLDSPSNRSFSYLVLSTPPYRRDRRQDLETIAEFTGAKLLPEEELQVVGDTDAEEYDDTWLAMTIPFEPEDEPQVHPEHLGEDLQLVLSNRQRTLLISKSEDVHDAGAWQLPGWAESSDESSWQLQTAPVLPVGPSETPQIWQQQAAETVIVADYKQQADHYGLVAGGGAALVWAQGKLTFDQPDDLDGERLALVEKGWRAFQTTLDKPLRAIADKAESAVDLNTDAPVDDLVQKIQNRVAPDYGYSLNKIGDGEGPSDYQLQPGDLSEERIARHAVPANAVGSTMRRAAMLAQVVLNMWILGGDNE